MVNAATAAATTATVDLCAHGSRTAHARGHRGQRRWIQCSGRARPVSAAAGAHGVIQCPQVAAVLLVRLSGECRRDECLCHIACVPCLSFSLIGWTLYSRSPHIDGPHRNGHDDVIDIDHANASATKQSGQQHHAVKRKRANATGTSSSSPSGNSRKKGAAAAAAVATSEPSTDESIRSGMLRRRLMRFVSVYCICRQPAGDIPMLACDGCDEWFHLVCVGVTEAQAEMVRFYFFFFFVFVSCCFLFCFCLLLFCLLFLFVCLLLFVCLIVCCCCYLFVLCCFWCRFWCVFLVCSQGILINVSILKNIIIQIEFECAQCARKNNRAYLYSETPVSQGAPCGDMLAFAEFHPRKISTSRERPCCRVRCGLVICASVQAQGALASKSTFCRRRQLTAPFKVRVPISCIVANCRPYRS